MTLRALGSDPAHLVHAAEKIARHNEWTSAILTTPRQVSRKARLTFIKKVDAQLRASRLKR